MCVKGEYFRLLWVAEALVQNVPAARLVTEPLRQQSQVSARFPGIGSSIGFSPLIMLGGNAEIDSLGDHYLSGFCNAFPTGVLTWPTSFQDTPSCLE